MTDRRSPGGKRVRNTFSSINRELTNVKVMAWLYEQAEALNTSGQLEEYIERLESIIIGQACYEKLKPKLNFSFMHGDFGKTNTLIDKNGRLFIYDWDSYWFGPKGFDLAYYFWKQRWPFKKIKKIFLNDQASLYFNDLEIIFIIYALIVLRFIDHYSGRSYKDDPADFLESAVKQIEKLACKL